MRTATGRGGGSDRETARRRAPVHLPACEVRGGRPARKGERGMVTAELAVGLLALSVVVVIAVWTVGLVVVRTQCSDVAAQVARQLARGDQQQADAARGRAPPRGGRARRPRPPPGGGDRRRRRVTGQDRAGPPAGPGRGRPGTGGGAVNDATPVTITPVTIAPATTTPAVITSTGRTMAAAPLPRFRAAAPRTTLWRSTVAGGSSFPTTPGRATLLVLGSVGGAVPAGPGAAHRAAADRDRGVATPWQGRCDERGAGSMLTAIAVLCTCLAMVVGVWATGWVASVHHARQAADLSALAGAQAQVLAAAGPPARAASSSTGATSGGHLAGGTGSAGQGVQAGPVCAAAARVAADNGARLLACRVEGDARDFVVHVTARVDLLPRVGGWRTTSWTSAAGSEPR